MMRKLLAVWVALVCGLAQAANYYWSGAGENDRWDNVDNWALDEALTKKSTVYPTGSDVVCLYTSSFSDHKISIVIPDGTQCNYVYVYDDGAPGTVVFTGEGTRPTFKPNGIYHKYQANQTASGYGTEVDFVNLTLSKYPLGGTGSNSGDNCRMVLDDCACDCANAALGFYATVGSSTEIRNSTLTNIQKISRTATTRHDLTISNSTVTVSSYWYLRGDGSRVTISDSTLNLKGQFDFAGANAQYSFARDTVNQQGTPAAMNITLTDSELTYDHVDFTGTGTWGESTVGGSGTVIRFINSDIHFRGKNKPRGKIYLTDTVWTVEGGNYAVGGGDADRSVFVIGGKRTKMLPGTYWNTGKASYEFMVPIGGFDQPPVGCDGELVSVRDGDFLSTGDNVNFKVLPESPAARVGTTAIYPLVYIYTGDANAQRLNLAKATLGELPNDESGYMSCSRSDVAFSDVVKQPADFWSSVEAGSKDKVSGLAVSIVGHDVRPPVLDGFSYDGVADEVLNFSLSLTSLGERPEGGSATSVIPTLIYRPVGETTWTEVPQDAITAAGVTTLTAPKSGFSDGNYEIGVCLVNDVEGETEYIAPGTVEISFSKATVSELTYVGEGVEATISGTVTGTGTAQTLPAILEVSETEDFSVIAATYSLGSVATGDAIEKTVEVNPGVLTYFRVTVGEGSAAGVATVSGTSRTVATIGEITAVNTNGLCRVAVDGSVVARGAGISTVKLRSSMDGISWQTNVIGTVSEDGSAFTGDCAFPMASGTAYYEILVENSSGDHTWVAASGVETLPVKDYSTYYWRAVENEWNGDWNDGRHWFKPDLPDDVTMYPQVDTATASFRDCPATDEAVVVTLPASVTVKQVESTTVGQKLTLKGAADVTLKALVRLDQANGLNTFDGLTVNDSASEVKIYGNGCVYALTNGAQMSFRSLCSAAETSLTITIGEDCVMTLQVPGGENGRKTILVDNGKLVHGGCYGQNAATGEIAYRLRGKKARVEFTGTGSGLNNSWKNVRFVFEIPEGGYNDIPVQLTKGTGSFLPFKNVVNLLKSAFCTPGDDNGLIFAVAADSPALLKGQDSAIDQDLFVWNTTGFAKGADDKGNEYDLIDYAQLQVPARTSAGRKVRHLTMHIRGVDEVRYDSPAALKAAGTTAYAVGCHIDRAPGFVVNVR